MLRNSNPVVSSLHAFILFCHGFNIIWTRYNGDSNDITISLQLRAFEKVQDWKLRKNNHHYDDESLEFLNKCVHYFDEHVNVLNPELVDLLSS
jgi:hypothetical protein